MPGSFFRYISVEFLFTGKAREEKLQLRNIGIFDAFALAFFPTPIIRLIDSVRMRREMLESARVDL